MTEAYWYCFGAGLLLGGLLVALYLLLRAQHTHDESYVPREAYNTIQEQLDVKSADYQELLTTLTTTKVELATLQTEFEGLRKTYDLRQKDLTATLTQSRQSFELLSNQLLKDNHQQSEKQLLQLLQPLRENIKAFQTDVQRRTESDLKDRVSLREELKMLRSLNQQISQDANNLAEALKGDKKLQGNWGELQLERLLEQSGLERDVHFIAQFTARDDDKNIKRPDFIINLPGDRHIVVDSKVSLVDYERYFTQNQAPTDLKNHITALKRHIQQLGSKQYHQLNELNSPDFLFLFVPIEPALILALREEPTLYEEALKHNIILVTTTTLLPTLRTVAYLWKQEKQSRHVQEIAKKSGQLYDKVVDFLEDMNTVGSRLESAQKAWNSAIYRLSEGKRYSDTIIGKAEQIKALGAQNTKEIPAEFINE